MIWVEFSDKTEFIAYHDTVAGALGLPKPGNRQSDSETMLENQWTTAHVRPVDDGGTLKAFVPDADVATYSLTTTTAPGGVTTKPSWDGEVDKQLPETWEGKPVPRPIVVVKDA